MAKDKQNEPTQSKQGETKRITTTSNELKNEKVVYKGAESSVLTMKDSKPTRIFFRDGKETRREIAK